MPSGSKGSDLSMIVDEQADPTLLFAPTIVLQRGFHEWAETSSKLVIQAHASRTILTKRLSCIESYGVSVHLVKMI